MTVRRRFGTCHVIFDGYETPSVKDHEHMRRSSQIKCKEFQFTNLMKVTTKGDEFLSNKKDKAQLISRRKIMLESDGQNMSVSMTDADTAIAQEALQVILNWYHVI